MDKPTDTKELLRLSRALLDIPIVVSKNWNGSVVHRAVVMSAEQRCEVSMALNLAAAKLDELRALAVNVWNHVDLNSMCEHGNGCHKCDGCKAHDALAHIVSTIQPADAAGKE